MLLFEHVEHGQCSSTGEVIATKRSAQLSIDGLELRRNQHTAHRETVGDALGDGDDVRTDIEPLVGEELTAAPVAALDLVADQDRAILLAGCCQTLGKLLGGELDAAHTLNALQDDGTARCR